MSTPMLKGGCVLAFDDAAATVTAARSVTNNGIDIDDPTAAAISDHAASSMLEKGTCNKNGTKILVFRRSTRYYNSVWAIG